MSRKYKKNKKQIKIIISSFVCLLLVMTAGYAAFSTNLTLTAKGNILNCSEVSEWVFDYKNEAQEFIVPCTAEYQIELWGASGGASQYTLEAGKGSYVKGNIKLKRNDILYVYVGEQGKAENCYNIGGYNGGGYSNYTDDYCQNGNGPGNSGSGGGSTDIRLVGGLWNDFESLKSRIMVAAAGGGATGLIGENYTSTFPDEYFYSAGGSAGGLIGYGTSNQVDAFTPSTGATQTLGGFNQDSNITGSFGFAPQISINNPWAGGGGSGYFAGITGVGQGGTGGSSYISGHNGCVAITQNSTEDSIIQRLDNNGKTCTDGTTDIICSYHYSNYIFEDTIMIDGEGYQWTTIKGNQISMPSKQGDSTIIGNEGNGYAKITMLSSK